MGTAKLSPESRTDFRFGRLWSFCDMLKAMAEEYILLGVDYRELTSIYYLASQEEPGAPTAKLSADEVEDVRKHLRHLVEVCEKLGMPISQVLLSASIQDAPETSREFEILWRAVLAELRSKLFLFVPGHRAKYYEPILVTEPVRASFPSASKEMDCASACYALGQFTASVFHSMRAAEIGVRALANAMNLTFAQPLDRTEWQPILTAIHGAINALGNQPRSAIRNEDLQFFSEASAQFRFFKDGWRVHVAHARETYAESQALEVLEHVRSFFEAVAPRLKE